MDIDLIAELVENHEYLVTVEEGAKGGFGAHVLHWLAETGRLDNNLVVRTMTLPDRFIDQASPQEMYADGELDSTSICNLVSSLLGVEKSRPQKIKIVS